MIMWRTKSALIMINMALLNLDETTVNQALVVTSLFVHRVWSLSRFAIPLLLARIHPNGGLSVIYFEADMSAKVEGDRLLFRRIAGPV